MSVQVTGYRHLIEPPVRGRCMAPDCRTVPVAERVGQDVLLVASYSTGSGEDLKGDVVCAPCDERRLRAWLES